jgi:hypothetical protein
MTALVRGEIVPWPTVGATIDQFLEACTHEDVAGLVYQRLTGSPVPTGWPAALQATLAENVRAQTARELVRREEIVLVLDALGRTGVQPVLIKGTPLAYTVYDVPASRSRGDTDLVVPRDALDPVRRAMAALGYTAPHACAGELLFGQLRLEKTDRLGVAHALDVHWRISSQSVFADVLTYDELAHDAVPLPALGPRARAAGALHALLLACLHPVMHHRNTEWIVWLYDVHLLVASLGSDALQQFGDLAVRKGVAAICAHQLAAARSRFGTPAAPGLMARLAAVREREPSAVYLRHGRRWHHELLWNVRGLLSWTDRLRLVREVLFPPPEYMLTAYCVRSRNLGLVLMPALYMHRGVAGIWKVLAGRK